MALTRTVLRWQYRGKNDLSRIDANLSSRQTPAEIPDEVRQRCLLEEHRVDDRRVVTLRARSGTSGAQAVHLHGGAYVYSIQKAHWRVLAELVDRSGTTIHVPLYGLAPQCTVDDALPWLDRVFTEIRRDHDGRLLLGGDSAGGGLALAQAVRMRDRSEHVDEMLLFSPWVDVTMTNPEISAREKRDPMLSRVMLMRSGRWWAGARRTDDPMVSPAHADLRRLAPTTMYFGGHDMLLADAREVAGRLCGPEGRPVLKLWTGGFHLFPAAMRTRESREAISDAVARLAVAS